jgi:hypothetical protein
LLVLTHRQFSVAAVSFARTGSGFSVDRCVGLAFQLILLLVFS